MNTTEFLQQLDARISKYDLLCHPFYKAWSAGRLTREDLREYAQDYYHHVEAFPSYLADLGMRLEDGELRHAVLANMCDEKGLEGRRGSNGVPHADRERHAVRDGRSEVERPEEPGVVPGEGELRAGHGEPGPDDREPPPSRSSRGPCCRT